jgi:GMP synthase (glutamine-hydrolysing)
MRILHLQCLKDEIERPLEIRAILETSGLAPEELVTVRPFDHPAPEASLEVTDGVIIGGSGWSVFEDVPRYDAFAAFLRAARARQVPILGICFGSQALAAVFGGAVIRDEDRAERGTIEVGLEPAAATDSLLAGLPKAFPAQASHHDRIVELPEDAVPLASSPAGILQAFTFPGERIWGVQFHPERTKASYERLLDPGVREEPPERSAAVRASLKETPEAASIMRRFAELVRATA